MMTAAINRIRLAVILAGLMTALTASVLPANINHLGMGFIAMAFAGAKGVAPNSSRQLLSMLAEDLGHAG